MATETIGANVNKRMLTLPKTGALVVVIAIVAAGVVGFRGVGRWLVCEDPLARADAIVILSGCVPYRAEEAAKVYRRAYAPEVWVTGGEEADRQVLIHSGVPAGAVRILPGGVVNTEQEVREITREMRDSGKSAVIIVTSSQHTRRVRALWRRLAYPNERAIVRATPQYPFDRDHWWRNTGDAYSVVHEVLGLANTWLGLPVRPARQDSQNHSRATYRH
jgi:uncharacterized SAM-binding protein YcdF (DUF218 family)